jgi:glycosyltransferase involved in cell wall biosynthesis
MNNIEIEIDSTKMDIEEKEIIKKATEKFERRDFQNARNDLLSLYKQDNNPRGLQYSIALCSVRLNKRRQARLFAFKELLDYPDNSMARRLLSSQNVKVNGKIIQHTFKDTKWPEKYPDISLVLIVKNEEKDLPRCLESFKDIVKEIIVVDTGSTDRTVEIAKSYGARVEYFQWCEDFAAARNESLKYATCEWILRTDADEYIEDAEKAKLLHCANSGLAEVYICPTVSITPTGEEVVENVRLIKNHLGITYEYPIHETIVNSTNRMGLTQCLANIYFRHTGYEDNSKGFMDAKIGRNVAVCEKYLVEHPDDYYVRLIRDLFIFNGPEKEKITKDIEDVLQKLPEDALAVRYIGLGYMILVPDYISQKRDIELLNILQDIQIDFNGISSIMQYAGEIYLYKRGDWKKSNKIFAWNVKIMSDSVVFDDVLPPKRYNKEKSCLLLADTCVLCNEYERARKYYLLAKKYRNDKLSQTESKRSYEPEEEFYDFKENELRELAKTLRGKSEWLNAYKASLRAGAKSKINFQDYLDMATCQIQLNNLKFAQMLLIEAEKLKPDSTAIKMMESMIAVKENNNEKALEKTVEAFVLEPGNPNYQRTLEQLAGILKMSPVDAIRKNGLLWLNSEKRQIGLFALLLYQKFKPEDHEIEQIIEKYTQ